MDKEKSQYNLNYTLEKSKEAFKEKQQSIDICLHSGAKFNSEKNLYYLTYLGFNVRVTPEGEVNCDETDLTIYEKIVILHYMTNAVGAIRESNLISYKELVGGEIYIGPFTNRAIKPLTKIFGHSPEKLGQVIAKWDGEKSEYGDFSIKLNVFPHVYIIYVIWEGDDEFPPNGNILFDQSINDYLSTEDIAVLASNLVYKMPTLLS